MKKLQFITILFSVLVMFSCKKKSTTSSNTNTTSSSDVYGLLGVEKIDTLKHGTFIGPFYSATASFWCSPNGLQTGASTVPIDSIRLNGIPMWYSIGDGNYYDTVTLYHPVHVIGYPYTFKVVDDSCIPSFSYTENGPYPTYTGYSNLPDTIYKNSNLLISFAGASNYDYIGVSIDDGSNLGTGHTASKNPDPPFPSSVTIPSSAMSQFNTGNKATITFYIAKMNQKIFANKTMEFATYYTLVKIVSIK